MVQHELCAAHADQVAEGEKGRGRKIVRRGVDYARSSVKNLRSYEMRAVLWPAEHRS
jgi:hypothetical protein